jgi:hypothetical protein
MAPERPDEHRDHDGRTDPTESTTAAWERFGPARDDLGEELDPDWRDWFDRGQDRFDGGAGTPTSGREPLRSGPDPVDGERKWLGVRWRRIGIPFFVLGAILFGVTSVRGWVTIVDVSRTRSQGTPGTFELEDCRYERTRRHYGSYHCEASFTGTDGRVQAPVKVVVEKSPEEGGTTRTGRLMGDAGWGDDIRLRPRILLELLGFVVLLVIVWSAVRKERKRSEPARGTF